MIKYLYLVAAVFLEVTATMLLPASQNFTRLVPTIILSVCYAGSFYLLTFILKTIPIAIVLELKGKCFDTIETGILIAVAARPIPIKIPKSKVNQKPVLFP